LEHGQLNDLGLFRLTASGYSVIRGSRCESRSPFLKIAYQISGRSLFCQNGRHVELKPEHWTIYDDNQPYTSRNPGQVQVLILAVPLSRILSSSIDLRKCIGMRLSAEQGIAKIAFNFILNALDEIAGVNVTQFQDLADIISHLLMLSLSWVQREDIKPTPIQSLRDRAMGYILENLRNPNLGVDQIAAVLGCSNRYLHKAFQAGPMTISDYIWSMRLARARDSLRVDPSSITEIAYAWGFTSSAHFSTLFRQHFGQTPRAARAQLLAPNILRKDSDQFVLPPNGVLAERSLLSPRALVSV